MLIADSGGSSAPITTAPVALSQIDPAVDSGFAASTYGTDKDWTLDTDLAQISSNVYNDSGTDIGEGGWSRVSDDTLEQAGILPTARDGSDAALTDPDTGFQAAIYTDGNNRVVVAFAGTDPTSAKDWLANATQGIGLDSAQYSQAVQLAQQAVVAFGAENVVFTGHSLGGGLASAAALATDTPAVTFNAAGVSDGTMRDLGFSPSAARDAASDGLVRRYNVEDDPLTTAQQKLNVVVPGIVGTVSLPDALGYQITLENPRTVEDPFTAHGNGTVLDAMRAQDVRSEDSDNLIEDLYHGSLVPYGPSLSDIVETGADVAGVVRDGAVTAYEAGRDFSVATYEATTDLAVDTYEATTDFAVDTYEGARDVGEDVYNATSSAVENTVEDGQEFIENVGDAVDPRNWTAPWN